MIIIPRGIALGRIKGGFDITPSQTFHLPAAQEANLSQYLGLIGGVKEIVAEVAKIKPETTRNLKAMFGSIERMGRANMLAPIRQSLMMPGRQLGMQVGNSIQTALIPTTLMMNQMVNQVTNMIIPFIQQYQQGAAAGGTIGFIAGYVLPGGPILWGLAGTFIGAGIEATAGGARSPFIPDFITEHYTRTGRGGDSLLIPDPNIATLPDLGAPTLDIVHRGTPLRIGGRFKHTRELV